MYGSARQVQVRVVGDPDSDTREVADLAWLLKEDLLRLDVDAVDHRRTTAPVAAKGDALAWAELVVGITGGLPALVGAIQSWLGRQDRGSVTIEIDGDALTVRRASPAMQRELVDAWLSRHVDRA